MKNMLRLSQTQFVFLIFLSFSCFWERQIKGKTSYPLTKHLSTLQTGNCAFQYDWPIFLHLERLNYHNPGVFFPLFFHAAESVEYLVKREITEQMWPVQDPFSTI